MSERLRIDSASFDPPGFWTGVEFDDAVDACLCDVACPDCGFDTRDIAPSDPCPKCEEAPNA